MPKLWYSQNGVYKVNTCIYMYMHNSLFVVACTLLRKWRLKFTLIKFYMTNFPASMTSGRSKLVAWAWKEIYSRIASRKEPTPPPMSQIWRQEEREGQSEIMAGACNWERSAIPAAYTCTRDSLKAGREHYQQEGKNCYLSILNKIIGIDALSIIKYLKLKAVTTNHRIS